MEVLQDVAAFSVRSNVKKQREPAKLNAHSIQGRSLLQVLEGHLDIIICYFRNVKVTCMWTCTYIYIYIRVCVYISA